MQYLTLARSTGSANTSRGSIEEGRLRGSLKENGMDARVGGSCMALVSGGPGSGSPGARSSPLTSYSWQYTSLYPLKPIIESASRRLCADLTLNTTRLAPC